MDPILRAFAGTLAAAPDAELVRSAAGSATRGQLAEQADTAAEALAPLGRGDGRIVALVAGNGVPFLAGLLALRRADFAALLIDPGSPAPAWRRIAEALGAHALFVLEPQPTVIPVATRHPLRLPGIAVIKLTSGSTGQPRGVATRSAALVADAQALSATMGILPDDRLLAAVPMSFSYGLSSLAIAALISGNTLVVPAPGNPVGPLLAAEAAEATVFPTVPAYVQALIGLPEHWQLPSSLRLILAAGAPLSPEVAARFRARFDRHVHAFYGSSETGGITYDRGGCAAERGTVGTPVEGVQVAVHDDGTIEVRSPALGDHYVGSTDDALANGRFLTGDLGEWRDGELALRGRRSGFINVGGHKVDPREVEAVIRCLPGIKEVVVAGRLLPDGAQETCHAIVAAARGAVTREDILHACREVLAPYKVPRVVTIVHTIPRNARGKIDFAAIGAGITVDD